MASEPEQLDSEAMKTPEDFAYTDLELEYLTEIIPAERTRWVVTAPENGLT